jgi:predicted NBD/HSP70 family sugar kinase
MDKKTKKARKLMELKRLVLNSDGIRRNEAAKLVDLDIRTASAYLEELVATGLLRCEIEPAGGKGRPGTLYYPNRENLCYLGLVISADLNVGLSVLDHRNQVLGTGTIRFDRTSSKLTVFRKVLELVQQSIQSHSERRLGAIGIAISRWLQPPLASYDLYSGLVDFLNRETGVPVYREVNINMLAFQASIHHGCRNLAFIHPGKVIEFGLVINGFPASNLFEHEDWLAHLPVNPNGRKCYCGQRGCLENYVTEGAIAERLHGLGVQDSPELSADIGQYLGEACREIADSYHPELIILRVAEKYQAGALSAYGRTTPQLHFDSNIPGVEKGAAMLASFLSTRQFIKETTGDHSK